MCGPHYKRYWRYGDPFAGGSFQQAAEAETYFQEIVLTHDGEGCLLWPFSRNSENGRAVMSVDGNKVQVHRRACEVVNGPPPTEAHEAAHNCGNGHLGCVSPGHTRWATHIENKADEIEHGTRIFGARNPKARLTASQVREVRTMRGSATYEQIAEAFGVSESAINHIFSGKNWGWLT
jgi:hypothetical protein